MVQPTRKPPKDWKPIFPEHVEKQRQEAIRKGDKPLPYKTWRPKRRKKSSFKE